MKVESNDELKEITIKNRTCYYFDEMIKFEDFDFDNMLIDGKSYENILVNKISHENVMGAKPLRVRFQIFWYYFELDNMIPFGYLIK